MERHHLALAPGSRDAVVIRRHSVRYHDESRRSLSTRWVKTSYFCWSLTPSPSERPDSISLRHYSNAIARGELSSSNPNPAFPDRLADAIHLEASQLIHAYYPVTSGGLNGLSGRPGGQLRRFYMRLSGTGPSSFWCMFLSLNA